MRVAVRMGYKFIQLQPLCFSLQSHDFFCRAPCPIICVQGTEQSAERDETSPSPCTSWRSIICFIAITLWVYLVDLSLLLGAQTDAVLLQLKAEGARGRRSCLDLTKAIHLPQYL